MDQIASSRDITTIVTTIDSEGILKELRMSDESGWAELRVGRNPSGPKSNWAEIQLSRNPRGPKFSQVGRDSVRWAEIQVGRGPRSDWAEIQSGGPRFSPVGRDPSRSHQIQLGVRPTRFSAHSDFGPPGFGPLGVRPTRSSAHSVFGPLGVRPTRSSAHSEFGPLRFRPTRSSAHSDFGPPGFGTYNCKQKALPTCRWMTKKLNIDIIIAYMKRNTNKFFFLIQCNFLFIFPTKTRLFFELSALDTALPISNND
jgi:hypothetical protein